MFSEFPINSLQHFHSFSAVRLEENDESRKLCDNEFGAPANDGDVTSLRKTRLETDRGVLEEIYVSLFSTFKIIRVRY